MKKTYVHNGKEVVLTGRLAKPKPRRAGLPVNENLTQYEIRPANITDPSDNSYNEWVRMNELLEIME